jgi:hypothetical protein
MTLQAPMMLETTGYNAGSFITIDDNNRYPQLCEGGAVNWGSTLRWPSSGDDEYLAAWFARHGSACLYKTRAGFDRVVSKLPPAPAPLTAAEHAAMLAEMQEESDRRREEESRYAF